MIIDKRTATGWSRIGSRATFGVALLDMAEGRDDLIVLAADTSTSAGLDRFRSGTLERVAFMHGLARIWAGLPLPNGQSYYNGQAGNKATMTWARFEGGMARIWPMEG